MTLKFDDEFTDAKIFEDEPMNRHTSLGVGGCARYFIKISSLYSLNSIISKCKSRHVKYKIIGFGTNLLVSDGGYDGVIICTTGLSDIFLTPYGIKVMAGAPLNKLIAYCTENSYTGLECLAGIPATVGGALVMNAGAFGVEFSDHVVTVETIKDGKLCKYNKFDCGFSYRKSRFKGKGEAVVSVVLDLEKGIGVSQKVKSVLELRTKLQPSGKSCGSVFKNPKGVTAGQLIDGLNLKGFSVGGATVSNKHANFIINASAKASDVYTLIQEIKQRVKTAYGINLIEEVEYIGDF
ncbi:MAG: UDP-N-acetylmuramate dehydrogenase [Clostridiales bacterium]|nr:UDP-N-acetylmuramate dehydrogenase [Clostridiales bacterium]